MSFESARRILASYKEGNANRIKMSIETAYNEALMAYKSEEAAREAAVEMLNIYQKSFDDYVKELSRSRRDFIKGERKAVQKSLQDREKVIRKNQLIEIQNKREERKVKNRNARTMARDEQKRAQYELDQDALKLQGAEFETPAAMKKLEVDAKNKARKVVLAHDLMNKGNIESEMFFLESAIKKGAGDSEIIVRTENLIRELNKTFPEESLTETGFSGDEEKLYPYRKADLGHRIQKRLKFFPLEPEQKDLTPKQKRAYNKAVETLYTVIPGAESSGFFQKVADVSEDDVAQAFQDEVAARMQQDPKRAKMIRRRALVSTPLEPDYIPTPLEEVPEEYVPVGADAGNLRQAAAPVFNALRDDYQIDAQEQEQLTPEAMGAYRELQDLARTNPTVVTREEELLLDELALQRQLRILQQQQYVGKMRPQMQSYEQIQRRAAQIAEPSRAKQQGQVSPLDQK